MKRTILIVSQVYVPDPASVGQHMHDAAAELARRGHRVVVLASARGYEDPEQRYPRRELLDGVEIVRLPLSSFGKGSIATRLAGGMIFLAQAALSSLRLRSIDAVVVSTSPPMCGMLGVALANLRRCPLVYWVMDINPDQIVATGAMAQGALPVRGFDVMNDQILRRADHIVVLDRYMRDNLLGKGAAPERITVLPPWHHLDLRQGRLPRGESAFREEQGLQQHFVVMYSGNMSPVHPVTTLLEAAERLRDDSRLLLLFVGGGNGLAAIREFASVRSLPNVRFLPYQPFERLHESLSAADVHLVAMGDEMVGIVHPCKVYGALGAGRPVLLLGPKRCHVSDILREYQVGYQVAHGDVDGAEALLRQLLSARHDELEATGERAHRAAAAYGHDALCTPFCDLVEAAACQRP